MLSIVYIRYDLYLVIYGEILIVSDRYVMVGNHRDSWVFGGVDASSGGSILLELARVFGEKMKTGRNYLDID